MKKGRVMEQQVSGEQSKIRVVGWDPRYRAAFVSLNRAWVEKYFAMEETDYVHFGDPEGVFVRPGGDILFVLDGERCVGTCALLKVNSQVFELSKIAVDERERGRGLGSILMDATLARARALGARRVFLHSNQSLTPALRLYAKHGFRTVNLDPHPDYARANIEMEIVL